MNVALGALAVVVAVAGFAVVITLVTLRYRLDLLIRQAREANRLLQASLRELRTVEHRLASRAEPEFGRVGAEIPIGRNEASAASWEWSRESEERGSPREQGSAPVVVNEPTPGGADENRDSGKARAAAALAAGQRRSEILASIRDPEITGEELTLLYEELRQLNREHRAWINSRMRPDLRRSL